MKWEVMKGKCLVCGRVRYKGKPVLRYKEFRAGNAVLECTVCKTVWEVPTSADAKTQVAG